MDFALSPESIALRDEVRARIPNFVEVYVECRWNHLRRQSLHGRLHAS